MNLHEQKDLLREAIRSQWVDQFLRLAFARRHVGHALLAISREVVFQYLMDQSRMVEREIRALVENVVIVKPSHNQPGAYKLATRWDISEHGDTHDGEYEQICPNFVRGPG